MLEEIYAGLGVTTTASPTTTSGASELLTGLIGYYALNEVSGTAVTDSTGTQNGVTNATVNSTGKISQCETFNGTTQCLTVNYNASQALSGATVTVATWVYINTLPSAAGHVAYLIRNVHTASPWECVYLIINTSNQAQFHVKNTSNVDFEVTSSVTLAAGQWYHIMGVCPGSGQNLRIYINGVDVSSGAEAFSGTIYTGLGGWTFGDAYLAAGSGIAGMLDEIYLNSEAKTAGNASLLYGSGSGLAYPF